MSNDSLKIKAAAFAVRRGHTDELAEAFVAELCKRGVLGSSERYSAVLEQVVDMARWPSARDALTDILGRHASHAAASKVAKDVLASHSKEIADKVRAEFYIPGDGCSGLVNEIADWIAKG